MDQDSPFDSVTSDMLLALAAAQRGHFRLESGHHSDMWFDLDGLFTDDERIAPYVRVLANRLERHRPAGVCGPLVGGAYLAQRIAMELAIPFFFTHPTASDADAMYSVHYRLPSAAHRRVRDLRLAIVDDVMSAGSALRGTYVSLHEHHACIVAVGGLMLLGEVGADFFHASRIPVEFVVKRPFNVWHPSECPLCRNGERLNSR